jgi:hypothetical protein
VIALLLVDKDLTDDCLRAYAYFRWADDVIDVSAESPKERVAFIGRQKEIVDCLYNGACPENLAPEEQMVADLIRHDRSPNSGLQSFIRNFLDVLEFDAGRKGQVISQDDLTWYSECLGEAVTDAIQYFVGNRNSYPAAGNQYLAATAAHITHMLRDFCDDINEGFFNLPDELVISNDGANYLMGFDPAYASDPAFREWLIKRVRLARSYFREGKIYLDELDSLRCKIAGYWYCARFECVLDAIERDEYKLRPVYNERRRRTTWLKTGWTTIALIVGHLTSKIRRRPFPTCGSRDSAWQLKNRQLGQEDRPLFG